MSSNFIHINVFRDALHNFDPRSGATSEKRMGILIGMVSVLMSQERSFEGALELCKMHIPGNYDRNGIPESWREAFDAINLDFNLHINYR